MAAELGKLARDLEAIGYIDGARVLRGLTRGLRAAKLIPEQMRGIPSPHLELEQKISTVAQNLDDAINLIDLANWDSKDYRGPQSWRNLIEERLTASERHLVRRALYATARHLRFGRDNVGGLRSLSNEEILAIHNIKFKTFPVLIAFRRVPSQ